MRKSLTGSDYIRLMKECLAAWNSADAEKTASFYAEDLDYRDPSVPEGIHGRADFIAYLKLLFRVWPRQEWKEKELMPHEKPGAFSISYDFSFGNDVAEIRGSGIDRMEFEGDKIKLNHVYLNALKFRDWIRHELKKK